MKTERQKMAAGELFNPLHPQVRAERTQTKLLLKELNDSREDSAENRTHVLQELIPGAGPGLWIQPPFYCDYRNNIYVGEKVFFNCMVPDVAPVTIGSRSIIGAISVVARNVPHDVLAAGDPNKVTRPL
jgi:maltose O-acetyltransferase